MQTEFVSETNLWIVSVNTQYTKQFLENQALVIDSLSSCESKLDVYPERLAFESRFLSEPKIKSMFSNKRRLKQEAANAYAWVYEIKLGDWVLMTSSTAFYLGIVTSSVLTTLHPKLKRNYVRSIEWCTVRGQRKDLDAEIQHCLALGGIAKAEMRQAASAFLYVLKETSDWSKPVLNKMVALFKPESFKYCLTSQYAVYREKQKSELTVDCQQGKSRPTDNLSSSQATPQPKEDLSSSSECLSATAVKEHAELPCADTCKLSSEWLKSTDTADTACFKMQANDEACFKPQEHNEACCKPQASDKEELKEVLEEVVDDVLEEVFEDWELVTESEKYSSSMTEIVQRMHEAFDGRLAYLVREILQVQNMQIESMDECNTGCFIIASSAVDQARYCILICEQSCDHNAWEELGRMAKNNQAAQSLLIAWGGLSGQLEPKQFMQTHICTELDMAKKFLDSYPFLSDETRQRLPVRKLWHLANIR